MTSRRHRSPPTGPPTAWSSNYTPTPSIATGSSRLRLWWREPTGTGEEPGTGEPVHILAYYGSCGPAKYEELDELLSSIRNGRYVRAKNMLLKLNKLKIPLKWDHVAKIAGNGVAPGRLHVARAMVEAGYVENLRQAFNRYLYDGGPAYAMGSEPFAETVVQLICRTGGVAALAHPWALKNPIPVIRGLKSAGLHAIEIYRSDGKVAGFSELAETYTLLKLGGSDYHGRGGHDESGLGSVDLPLISVYGFLKMARPIWCNAVKDILLSYADEPSAANLEKITRFRKLNNLKGYSTPSCGKDVIDQCLSSWLTNDEKEGDEFEAIRMKLAHIDISNEGSQKPIVKG
ncbi:3',5'-nucleoside bisphosphate phosphatase-like isoform X2 [Phoenix dactylifera]|uniref:3',5'-nucleoside bisphosphate phosphatase-like isoform X2 n=1 Tax=Phoenix dactylifera TaxID=42345 RepID=A0A8B9ADM4_PHODC|nr:3',5'-nucleoside bisphosphate phosphatase-like isoform X2 [Phoenix dactylifera]